jgi:hypothetical protein
MPQQLLWNLVTVRLRGAAETWEAVERDAYRPAACVTCDNDDLFVVESAVYVLCPICREVSPVQSAYTDGSDAVDSDAEGVGLGFSFGDLCRWQSEILRHRRRTAKEQEASASRR